MNPEVIRLLEQMEQQLVALQASQAKALEIAKSLSPWSDEEEAAYRARHQD